MGGKDEAYQPFQYHLQPKSKGTLSIGPKDKINTSDEYRKIYLEFGVLLVLLDFDRGGILSASNEKEFLDLVDLSWHFYIRFLNS